MVAVVVAILIFMLLSGAALARQISHKYADGERMIPAYVVEVDIEEAIRAAIRQAPEKYSFGSTGYGSPAHLQGEMFKLAYKLDLQHVPFSGGGPALQSAVSGHVPMTFSALPPAVPMVQSGLLRALAVVGPERVGALPDVPTMAEAGLPGFDTQTNLFALAPAGTPQQIIDLLHDAFGKAIRDPEVQQKFAVLGFKAVGTTPAETAQRIKDELALWVRVAREANLQQQPQ